VHRISGIAVEFPIEQRGKNLAVAERKPGILHSRNLGRYREVLGVLMRYGLTEVVENLAHGRLASPRISPGAIRDALCELGPAFIKLGQLLSSRNELLSEPFREELAKLQDQVTPFSFEIAREVIESELGAPVGELFERIDSVPIASGSIGQVHRARLPDGTEVVIKVQRPGLEDLLATDSAIIRQLFGRFGSNPEMGDSASRLISDFLDCIQTELDYAREAAHLDRFAWQFEHDAKIRVPRLIGSHSTHRVLTMTYVQGLKLAEIAGVTTAGKNAVRVLASTILKQIFAYGFFHGDPHAANVVVAQDESIGFYDFGLVGELSIGERECAANLLLALLEQQPEAATDALIQLAEPSGHADLHALRSDMTAFTAKYFRQSAADVPVHRLLDDILQMTARHHLILPSGFYLVFKVLATLESVGRKLDPAFDLAVLSLPILRRSRSSAPLEQVDAAKFFEVGVETLKQLHGLPLALRNTFHQLSQGQLRIQFEHRGLEDAAFCYDRAGMRLGSVLFVSLLTLGGYGVICCLILARMIVWREAMIAAVVLACASALLVFVLNRTIGHRAAGKRGRRP
jgi:ubiquinone biosynthesis protein